MTSCDDVASCAVGIGIGIVAPVVSGIVATDGIVLTLVGFLGVEVLSAVDCGAVAGCTVRVNMCDSE